MVSCLNISMRHRMVLKTRFIKRNIYSAKLSKNAALYGGNILLQWGPYCYKADIWLYGGAYHWQDEFNVTRMNVTLQVESRCYKAEEHHYKDSHGTRFLWCNKRLLKLKSCRHRQGHETDATRAYHDNQSRTGPRKPILPDFHIHTKGMAPRSKDRVKDRWSTCKYGDCLVQYDFSVSAVQFACYWSNVKNMVYVMPSSLHYTSLNHISLSSRP